MTPTFSVVIPVYNVAPYLRACLDSVWTAVQTLSEKCEVRSEKLGMVEVICVDDGSTDGSGEILDAYSEKDARFRVIHKKNAGVSAARNDGMRAARGDYLIFVDADDAVVPWMLEDLVEAMSLTPDCDFYTFSAQRVTDMNVPLPPRCPTRQSVERIDIEDPLSARTAYERVNGVMLAWGACYRKKLAVSVGFKNYPNGEDALFGYTCLIHAKSIAFLNAQLYRYRLPRPGSANNATFKNLKSCLDIVEEYRMVGQKWSYAHCVREIAARKSRSGLVGVVYPILLKLPPQDRDRGRQYFMDSLRQRFFVHDEAFPSVDKFFTKLACRLDSLFLFHLCVYLPFLLRSRLARVPLVNALKNAVRSARRG